MPRNGFGQDYQCTVSSQFLWRLRLNSVWKTNRCYREAGGALLVEVNLLDSNPYFLWRDTTQQSSPTFFDRPFAEINRTSKYPAYQVIDAQLDGQSISICVSCFELLRFFIGQSPVLSCRLYRFTETLSNPNLYT